MGGYMKIIKIGIYDEEREYVEMLSSFLNDWGKGKWRISGYTSIELLKKSLENGRFDLLVSPDLEVLSQISTEDKEVSLLFLSGENQINENQEIINQIYRFQSANEIAKGIQQLVNKKRKQGLMDKKMIGIYSPIGRCGKTSLAYDMVRNKKYGNYIYFGMEDFCSFEIFSDTGEMLYYIKERKEEKFLKVIHSCDGKVILGQGAFENRLLDKEDLVWIKKVLKESIYDGIIFDIGTGSIKDMYFFCELDYLFVPLLYGSHYDLKMENFKKTLKLYDLEDIEENFLYLDMSLMEEVEKKVGEIMI